MITNEYNLLMKENFIKMKNMDTLVQNEKYYLGDLDARTEWEDSPEIAKALFLHTESYEEFLDNNSLILLGRTGTGKTAILRCIEDAISTGQLEEYKHVLLLSFDDILGEFSSFLEIDNSAKSKDDVTRTIKWIINIAVMKFLITKFDTPTIREYLTKNGLITNISVTDKIKKGIEPLSGLIGKYGEAINIMLKLTDFANSIYTKSDYQSALDEMFTLLDKNPILVLIDSSNEYDMRDNRIVIILKALINNCFEYHSYKSKWHINVKLALPSEIYTHILQYLPGKQKGNTVVIRWKYDDLVCFIAKRFCYYLSQDKYGHIFDFLQEYKLNELSDFESANNLLANILPEMCPTNLKYDFDTIPYCIRHTLKKPRELMLIFNALIQKIVESKNAKIYFENSQMIKDVIHSTQELMISSSLSMYENSYPNIQQACSIVLNNNPFIFRGKDIEDKLKEASAFTTNYGYDDRDIKRVLLESGLLGVVTDVEYINNMEKMHSDKKIRVITARFEYQVKGSLFFNTDEYYVIHPMCYEHFTCGVNPYTLVYVDKNSDPNDKIITLLKNDVLILQS